MASSTGGSAALLPDQDDAMNMDQRVKAQQDALAYAKIVEQVKSASFFSLVLTFLSLLLCHNSTTSFEPSQMVRGPYWTNADAFSGTFRRFPDVFQTFQMHFGQFPGSGRM